MGERSSRLCESPTKLEDNQYKAMDCKGTEPAQPPAAEGREALRVQAAPRDPQPLVTPHYGEKKTSLSTTVTTSMSDVVSTLSQLFWGKEEPPALHSSSINSQ